MCMFILNVFHGMLIFSLIFCHVLVNFMHWFHTLLNNQYYKLNIFPRRRIFQVPRSVGTLHYGIDE